MLEFLANMQRKTGSGTNIRGTSTSSGLLGDTSSLSSLDQLNTWISRCERHGPCQRRTDTKCLPQRVIDVTNISNGGRKGVKIIETANQQGIYATLSHCWGDEDFDTVLTKKTMPHYLQFISYNDLPRTFQEAIQITRHIGLQYLWIDSLCLLQDDKDDRAKQTAKMDEIYGNSFIVIAAAASDAARGGCFSKHTPDKCLQISTVDGQELIVGIRWCSFPGVLKNPQEVYKWFPLSGRGWAYQERLLATRLLSCNRTELVMECGVEIFCECGSRGIAPHITEKHGGLLSAQLVSIKTQKLAGIFGPQIKRFEPHITFAINECWQIAVSRFAALRFRNPDKDILKAFSGCARVFQSITGDTYLAGLWLRSIQHNLLWWVANAAKGDGSRSVAYRAPSWSWASLNTPSGVAFFYRNFPFTTSTFTYSVVGYEYVLENQLNPFGRIKSACLVVKASLRNAYARMVCRQCKEEASNRRRFELETTQTARACTFMETGIHITGGPGTHVSFYSDISLKSEPGLHWILPTNLDSSRQQCQLTPIYLLHAATSSPRHLFLALKRSIRNPGSYERIALVEIDHRQPSTEQSWFEEVWLKNMSVAEEVRLV